ncbi:MAG: metal ABC transporter permease [Candidatus Bipolaricaulota bacterium]|nr:MAG: metal ABC transporter permease [Candidatus Bipolaricaulota bacterium]
MLEWIAAPWGYPFMVRALIAASVVGLICSVIGSFVVLRGMAFLGDAIAHSILPGVALGYLVGARDDRRALFWWALATAVVVAVGVGWVSRRVRLREDAAIGIVFTGMFALGIALISTVRGFAVDLVHLLFGNILAVSGRDLVLMGAFAGVVLLIVFAFYKEFLLVSFDPVFARTLRLPTAFYRYTLLILVAVTVVVALRAVGIGLMLAMLITPPSAASLLVRRLPLMIGLSAVLGILSGVVGLYLSFYTSVASGAAIVMVAVGLFLAVLMAAPVRRRMAARRHRVAVD